MKQRYEKMMVLLKSGNVVSCEDANRCRVAHGELMVVGARNHVIAEFPIDSVDGWWFACEKVLVQLGKPVADQ